MHQCMIHRVGNLDFLWFVHLVILIQRRVGGSVRVDPSPRTGIEQAGTGLAPMWVRCAHASKQRPQWT